MTIAREFVDGWKEGIRPFCAAMSPLLKGAGTFVCTIFLAVLLSLAQWPMVAMAVVLVGCVTGGGFFIYAWIVIFWESGFLHRKVSQ